MEIFNVPNEMIKRYYDEKNELPDYRTEFMRDRDRVLYATAFRRLSGKTQIYTVGTDDHKRNRLTHTLEVSQIARTIAQGLGLNPDLAEAIALAHDFGHTPFGHAGEQMLHEIMIPNSRHVKNSPYNYNYDILKNRFELESQDQIKYLESAFGFKHNLQSVRVSATLEDSYRGEKNENIGLNLTNYTIYGMMIHSKLKYESGSLYPNYQNNYKDRFKMKDSKLNAWSFEAYIVAWADEFAQWHHDLEDAIRGEALPLKKICETIQNALGDNLSDLDRNKLNNIQNSLFVSRKTIAEISHIVVNTLVDNLIKTSKRNFKILKEKLENYKITSAKDLFEQYDDLNLEIEKENVICICTDKCDKEIPAINTEIFSVTIKNSVHYSRNVERMNEKGKYIIRKLFEAYYAHPQQLPDGTILHLLVDVFPKEYKNIDIAREQGIGQARADFDKKMKNPSIYFQCVLMRRICDHIASMTDRYALEEYNNLYG